MPTEPLAVQQRKFGREIDAAVARLNDLLSQAPVGCAVSLKLVVNDRVRWQAAEDAAEVDVPVYRLDHYTYVVLGVDE